MSNDPHKQIIAYYRGQLARYGDNAAGMGWTAADADVRYKVMLDCIRSPTDPCSLLDFGCGAGHLLEYIRRQGLSGIDYHGLDASTDAIELCRSKFPAQPFQCRDILADEAASLPVYDYVVMNGIFTDRRETPQQDMFDYCRELLRRVFPHARRGLAFNVMSKQVDWEREDLFHLPLDPLLDFLSRELSRHVVFRHDYGLYEYTVYVYTTASAPQMAGSKLQISAPPR